ncbi:MAG TPA: MG2 domain-containing protein, partial [Bryobacteraceae bacterium]|nr:MG2 domain-containing protein [Bryobacteraceae bacterium]
MIKRSRVGRWIFLFAAAVALPGQGENQPYFGLHSGDTFRSGGSPTVSLTAWNVDSLQFRVYRVRDPEKFFRQLEEPHSFGGVAPRPPHTKSVLERLRSWKRGLKADIRRSLRAQYTEPPHTHFENLFPKKATPVTKNVPGAASQYADAPLLNPDQMVMSFVHPVHGHERWQSETVDIPVKDRGVYLVEAVNNDLRAYTLLMVSDLALITKTANGRVVNFLVDRATGQPVSGAKVAGFVKGGEPVRGETNGDGIAELKVAPGNDNEVSVLARTDNDLAVNSLWAGNNGGEWNGYVYTDRPVYRPGHTVHFRAVIRTRGISGYQTPAGHKLLVQIEDPEQKPVYQKTLAVGAAGTIHDELTLPAAAALGNYSVNVKPDDDSQYSYIYGNFEVQEYKKPEYSVRVTAAKPRAIQGETVQATIDAQYFFGEPVAGAKVKYRIYKQRYWFPLWYDADDAEDSPAGEAERDDDFGGDQQSEQTGELNADGKLTISIPTMLSERRFDTLYRIEAGVTDAANREVSGTGWLVATYGSFAVNVAPDRYIYAPGQQGSFTIQARDYDNKPIHTRVHLELHRERRGKEQGAVLASADAETDANGSARASLTMPRDGGSYLVRVTARTPEGRDVEDVAYIWNAGGAREGSESRDQSVQIVTDKKSYSAGETAKLMIVAGQRGTAVYVTVGGRNIEEYRLLRAQDATVSFDLPLSAQSEPGISVNASFVRNGVLYSSDKYVRVPPAEHTLNVKVSTDKPQYQPGQTATYSIDVTGADGKPVPRAEFSLGVVDEAIYGVRRDTTQDIVSFFYGRDFRTPSTSSSLSYYFSGEAGKRRMQLAGLRPRSHLAQLKPERLVQPKVRKAFPDTAFWAADLTTDAAGHARARIDFPDSLTTWRATARGVTPDTRVGNSTLKTIVRKNIIVRLAAPRFFVRGDEVTIPVIVHNYLTDAKTARVSLDVSGLDVVDGATKDVQVPSRGEVTVNWKVRAQQTSKATLTAKALTNEESDALQIDLPIHFAGIQMALPHGGSEPAGESTSFDISYPQGIEPGSRSLRIQVSPSIAGSLFGALEYLTSFPYGCVEQTMSSFLPDIVVQDTMRNLHLKVDLDEAALQEKIHAGLDRLYGFQHPDGGWGWWETDDSHPFMTAYVVAGLAQARDAGVQITPDVIHKGAVWLNKEFTDDPKLVPDFRAY